MTTAGRARWLLQGRKPWRATGEGRGVSHGEHGRATHSMALRQAVVSYSTRGRVEMPGVSVELVTTLLDCFELSGISGQGFPCEGKARYNILALRRVW
jgi:hypothetical protein